MKRRSTLYLILIFIVLVAIKIPNLNSSEFWINGGDESRHAMNGVFIMDFFRDMPVSSPMQYVQEYYAKLPALSLYRNPPLFYVVEALFFLIFGISTLSANLSVMLLLMVGIVCWYKLLEKHFDPEIALLSCLFLFALKSFLFYYNAVMLEVPFLIFLFIFL